MHKVGAAHGPRGPWCCELTRPLQGHKRTPSGRSVSPFQHHGFVSREAPANSVETGRLRPRGNNLLFGNDSGRERRSQRTRDRLAGSIQRAKRKSASGSAQSHLPGSCVLDCASPESTLPTPAHCRTWRASAWATVQWPVRPRPYNPSGTDLVRGWPVNSFRKLEIAGHRA